MSVVSAAGFQAPALRNCPINLQHWYGVALSSELRHQPLSVTLWHQAIVLFRDSQGHVHALEDRCPHRQVKLSDGKVVQDNLECIYHGWQFDGGGHCASIPYLSEKQKIPPCRLRVYPVLEQDGFIWLYPGDQSHLTSHAITPLGLPEWHHLNYIASVTTIDCQGHFSFLIENLMDMYHGHLHDNYQAWASASLQTVQVFPDRVEALYNAQSYYRIDKIWSISQLFFPRLRRLHPEPLTVSYCYPHWRSSLGEDFKIYCLLCPVSETQTRAFLVHFTSLEAFPNLHKLPIAFRQFLKNRLFGSARSLLAGLVEQDVAMIEQEQRAYQEDPPQRTYEVNPVLGKVQQLICDQAENALGGFSGDG